MTLTHLPTKVSILSNQTFGFVSGAEGFIFLAGFMIGQLENRIEEKSGTAATFRDLVKRTLRVYAYHAGLLAIAFSIFAPFSIRYGRLALQNLLSFYLAHPKPAIAAAALLDYRPSLFDILPLYIVFMVLTPLARRIARRWGWDPVVYASFALWAAAQFGLRAWLYRHVDIFGLKVPENSTGAFDMYAWQLLWLVGLALGSIFSQHLSQPASPAAAHQTRAVPAWLITASVILASIFLVLRYSPVDHWINPDSYGWLIDKWHLGPARVINFAAVGLVLMRYGRSIAAWPLLQPLATLGRASLEVFSVHILCCLAGVALSTQSDPDLPWWQQAPLLLFTIGALFLTAHLHQTMVAARKAKRPAPEYR